MIYYIQHSLLSCKVLAYRALPAICLSLRLKEVSMYLREVLKAVDSIVLDGQACPGGKLEEGDEIVGELPDDFKKFLLYIMGFEERERGILARVEARIAEVGGNSDDVPVEEREGFFAERESLRNDHALANHVFWGSVYHAFPKVAEYEAVAVREGWQVVGCRSQEELSMEELMRMGGVLLM